MTDVPDTDASRGRGAEHLALVLDADDLVAALRLARDLKPWFGVAKVGLELFSAAGPDAIGPLIDLGYDVFLDLKLHDIPTTVNKASRVLGALGVSYVTMHAHGGVDMLRAGVEGLAEGSGNAGLAQPDRARGHGAHERQRGAAAHRAEAGEGRARGRLRRHRVRGGRPRRGPAVRTGAAEGGPRHPLGRRAEARPGPLVDARRRPLSGGCRPARRRSHGDPGRRSASAAAAALTAELTAA